MSNILLGGTIQANGPFPTVDGNAQEGVNFADPTQPQSVATKAYTDANGSNPIITIQFGNILAGDAIVFDTSQTAPGSAASYLALKNLGTLPYDPSTTPIMLIGWALADALSGATVRYLKSGLILPAVTGLTGGSAGLLTVDYVTGRLIALTPGDVRYGYCDPHGNAHVSFNGFIG